MKLISNSGGIRTASVNQLWRFGWKHLIRKDGEPTWRRCYEVLVLPILALRRLSKVGGIFNPTSIRGRSCSSTSVERANGHLSHWERRSEVYWQRSWVTDSKMTAGP